VLVVDDVVEIRGMLRQALRLQGDFEVVAEAADGAEAVAAARAHQPAVIVLDLGLPDLAGHEVVTALRAAAPDAHIVVYTGALQTEPPDLVHRVEAVVHKDQDVRYLISMLEGLVRDGASTAVLQLGPARGDVALAREFVTERCAAWGFGLAADDARLVVSELVTNALVHASTRCELRVRRLGRVLRLSVDDRGAGTPDLQAPDEASEHGRGLLLVSAVCTAWGVEASPDGGKRVWAELLLPEAS
jgi:CheY-like chemotaxis protein/anti-sigma regulatory factor (Ser/Thr protein kinase)